MKTATEILLDYNSKRRFYPIEGFDPLQELLAGTFYATIARDYEPIPWDTLKQCWSF